MRSYREAVEDGNVLSVTNAYCNAHAMLKEAEYEIHCSRKRDCPLRHQLEQGYVFDADKVFETFFGPLPSKGDRQRAWQNYHYSRCGYGSFMD